ncbi:MAG TPA: hypothetical protein VFX65_04560, partial [Candidatus Limnocylindrales bacterium]|nr:hypothetical protein [Candidatus Limnocylindrales bacterium]
MSEQTLTVPGSWGDRVGEGAPGRDRPETEAVGERIGEPGGRSRRRRALWTAAAIVATLPFVVPFAWLVLSALKPVGQFYAFPPTLLPDPP